MLVLTKPTLLGPFMLTARVAYDVQAVADVGQSNAGAAQLIAGSTEAVGVSIAPIACCAPTWTCRRDSVASELWQWSHDRERLGPRDLLIIDEASTLETAWARDLLAEARTREAVVVLLGDHRQFQAVAYGNARLADRDHGEDRARETRTQTVARDAASSRKSGSTALEKVLFPHIGHLRISRSR